MNSTKIIFSRKLLQIYGMCCNTEIYTVVFILLLKSETKEKKKIIICILRMDHTEYQATRLLRQTDNKCQQIQDEYVTYNAEKRYQNTTICISSQTHQCYGKRKPHIPFIIYVSRELKYLLLSGFKTVNSLLILQFHKFYSSIHCSVMSVSMYLQIYILKVVSGNLTIPEMEFMWHRKPSVPRNIK